MNPNLTEHTRLGRTNLDVSRIGIASGYGVPAEAVDRAYEEFGINYFYWDRRKAGMREALTALARRQRHNLVLAIQSYDHVGLGLRRSTESALKKLGIEYADILFLGWFNSMPSGWVMDAARKLKEEGKVRFLGVTGHNREFHGQMARDPKSPFDVLQVRYNAAHRGAETDVFTDLPDEHPGIVTYTATRWGQLTNYKKVPDGEPPLCAADCYRFVLSHPAVNVCLAGPRTEQELYEGLQALKWGPMSEEEMVRARRIGDFIHK